MIKQTNEIGVTYTYILCGAIWFCLYFDKMNNNITSRIAAATCIDRSIYSLSIFEPQKHVAIYIIAISIATSQNTLVQQNLQTAMSSRMIYKWIKCDDPPNPAADKLCNHVEAQLQMR